MKLTHHYKLAMNYLKKRNITDKIIRKFNIGFCYDGPFANRIIIPSYDENRRINYFIARSFLTKTKLKYKNPEVQKELIIFNESLIDWSKKIYLVEGVFDSIFLDNAIPMLGKYISDLLYEKLYNLRSEITIVLDGDAWEDAENLYHKLNCGKLMGKINIVKLPVDKDIADLCGDLSKYKEFKLD
jgi:DNA primase